MGENFSPAKKQLVDEMMRTARTIHQMKASVSRDLPEKAAYSLLFPLLDGDRRASELAEIIHSDPSTASRHIAHLVGNGLAKRVADQQDGRATLVSVTDTGREFCAAIRTQRDVGMAKLLQSWSDQDAEQFTTFMTRFNDDFEANFQNVVDGIRHRLNDAGTNATTIPDPDKETA